MQDDVIALCDHALKLNALTRIFLRHPRKIRNKSFLAIGYDRIVLNVDSPCVRLHHIVLFIGNRGSSYDGD